MSTPQSTLLAARNAALYYSKRQQARDNMLTPLSEVEAFREGYEEGRGDAEKELPDKPGEKKYSGWQIFEAIMCILCMILVIGNCIERNISAIAGWSSASALSISFYVQKYW